MFDVELKDGQKMEVKAKKVMHSKDFSLLVINAFHPSKSLKYCPLSFGHQEKVTFLGFVAKNDVLEC